MTTAPADRYRSALPALLLAVLTAFTAQQVLLPVLAPLSREVALSEVAIGGVISAAAVCFALSSLVWGRLVGRLGVRAVLVLGLVLALLGLVGFAVVSALAIRQDWPPTLTWVAMAATRSLLYGGGVGAVPVAAMVYVSATTVLPAERTGRLGQVGAVQGVAVALGPALAALLGFAGVLGPVWLAPVLVLVALAAVAFGVRPVPSTGGTDTVETGSKPVPLRPWDRRLWPMLLVGFLTYLALGLVLIVLGFLVGDRLGLTPAETVRSAGVVSFASGLALIAVQGFAVPRLRWPPGRLLRVGLPVAAVALAGLALAPTLATITATMTLLSLGLGLAIPGITAAATLAVGASEQGAVAGLVNATTGLTFVLGPVLGTALYQVADVWPMVAGAMAAALAALLAFGHPALRAPAPPVRGTDPVTSSPPQELR